jgi:hypothetical protein
MAKRQKSHKYLHTATRCQRPLQSIEHNNQYKGHAVFGTMTASKAYVS